VRPGVPDVIAVHRGQVYAIELKTEGGRATDAQLEAIEDIRTAGGHAEVRYGLDYARRAGRVGFTARLRSINVRWQ